MDLHKFFLPWVFAIGVSGALAQSNTVNERVKIPNLREWTRADGKKITAEYLGVLDQSVYLKLASGKIVPCPLAKLTIEDNNFVRGNPMEYRAVWREWPSSVEIPIATVNVREAAGSDGNFIYTTRNFRFRTNVNLGVTLMQDLARIFELTHDLHSKSPFGILATPVDQFYQAELFGTKQSYLNGGGIVNTGGVYKYKEKKFLAPLELMGLEPGPAGWRKISKVQYDPTTIVHELTHMLTHDMLDNLPTWVNEGYAEYIAHIPIENGTFRTDEVKIKIGVMDVLMEEYAKGNSHPLTTADIGYGGARKVPQKRLIRKICG